MEKVNCAVCGKDCTVEGHGIASNATLIGKPGDKLCYACCAKNDRRRMDRDGRIVLYLICNLPASHLCTVQNWPGSLRFHGKCKVGRHNIARTRYDVWFEDHNGNPWHGVQYGDNTQICHCRKISKK